MTLFLSVLKIIGIVLLIILGIAISLLLIILFVPFRYRIKGEVRADDNYYDFRADVTWFLHIIHGIFTFLKQVIGDDGSDAEVPDKQGFHYEIRLFGIKIRPKKEDDEEEEAAAYPAELPSENRGNKGEEEAGPENRGIKGEEETGPENQINKEEEHVPEKPVYPEDYAEQQTNRESRREEDIPEGFPARVKDFAAMLRSLPEKLKRAIEKAGCKYRGICDRIDELKSRLKHYYELYNDGSTGKALKLALNELMRILRALKPRRYSIDLLYGFEDPALTGEFTGLLSALFLSSGKRVSLRPDFERSVMEGKFFLKGRIRIITLVIVLWKLYFSKDFRKFFKEIRE